MSFSAHADAKGIMQLIRMAEPRNMLLVHGEGAKMEFLKGKIEQEFSECTKKIVFYCKFSFKPLYDALDIELIQWDCPIPDEI